MEYYNEFFYGYFFLYVYYKVIMETKLIENINKFVANYNDLDKDYKVKHNELLVIFDYFKIKVPK